MLFPFCTWLGKNAWKNIVYLLAASQGDMPRGHWAPALWDGIGWDGTACGDDPALGTREGLTLGNRNGCICQIFSFA